MILKVENIHTYYGVSHILFNVSLELNEGEIVCLLGRNGAGKTTTFRSIMGLTPPKSGIIQLKGEDISHKPSYLIARKGLGYVPSGHRLFRDLTVLQNLEVATKNGVRDGKQPWTLEKIYKFFPVLEERKQQRAGSMSGGEQQMLLIARTLMGNPEIIVLDEPSTGLSPLIVNTLDKQIRDLRDEGISILIAEQNANFAMKISDRAYIIDKGEICYQGSTQDLKQNKELMFTYLAV